MTRREKLLLSLKEEPLFFTSPFQREKSQQKGGLKTLQTLAFPSKPTPYFKALKQSKSPSIFILSNGESLTSYIHFTPDSLIFSLPEESTLKGSYKNLCYSTLKKILKTHTKDTLLLDHGLMAEIIERAIALNPYKTKKIYIQTAIEEDLDKAFFFYLMLARHTKKTLVSLSHKAPVFLETFPPVNLSFFSLLKQQDISLIMNLDFFQPSLFQKYRGFYGHTQAHFLHALEVAVSHLGKGHVYSRLLTYADSPECLNAGFYYLSNIGVVPIIEETALKLLSDSKDSNYLKACYALRSLYEKHGYLENAKFLMGKVLSHLTLKETCVVSFFWQQEKIKF